MILPWLKGFLSWSKVPMTWALILTNVFIFILTYKVDRKNSNTMFSTKQEIILTGKLYEQYLIQQSGDLFRARAQSEEQFVLLGSQGMRNPDFIRAAGESQFYGDEVAIADWKKNLLQFQQQFSARSTYLFGLVSHDLRPLTWITYQFMHAGWIHLGSNMVLLLIFGAALELNFSALALALVYILGGLAGGLGFILLSASSMAPMVGASGALSAVMAFYATTESKRRVAYFYFLSPMKDYFGVIYLPTLLIFPLCFLTDVASYLATPAELGSGVAFTAHIGGALLGTLMGVAIKIFTRSEQSLGARGSR